MKKLLFIGLIMITALACQENKKSSTSESDAENEISTSESNDVVQSEEEQRRERANREESEANTNKTIADWNGQFIKVDAENNVCECNCIELNFQGPTKLCIDQNAGIDIQVKFSKDNDVVNIHYLNGSGNIEEKNPIPWSDFDKNNIIATITRNGSQLNLDWKGFTIDQKLATDYAILGKKNLEGTYKRK